MQVIGTTGDKITPKDGVILLGSGTVGRSWIAATNIIVGQTDPAACELVVAGATARLVPSMAPGAVVVWRPNVGSGDPAGTPKVLAGAARAAFGGVYCDPRKPSSTAGSAVAFVVTGEALLEGPWGSGRRLMIFGRGGRFLAVLSLLEAQHDLLHAGEEALDVLRRNAEVLPTTTTHYLQARQVAPWSVAVAGFVAAEDAAYEVSVAPASTAGERTRFVPADPQAAADCERIFTCPLPGQAFAPIPAPGRALVAIPGQEMGKRYEFSYRVEGDVEILSAPSERGGPLLASVPAGGPWAIHLTMLKDGGTAWTRCATQDHDEFGVAWTK